MILPPIIESSAEDMLVAVGIGHIDLEGNHIILHEEEEHPHIRGRSHPVVGERLEVDSDLLGGVGGRKVDLRLRLLCYQGTSTPFEIRMVDLLLIVP